MSSMLKCKFKNMLHSFSYQLILLFAILASLVSLLHSFQISFGKLSTQILSLNQQFLGFNMSGVKEILLYPLFPLFASIAYSCNYIDDKRCGMSLHIYGRTQRFRYFTSGYIISFVAGFSILFITFLLNITTLSVFAPLHSDFYVDNHLPLYYFLGESTMVFQSLFYNHPYWYMALYVIIPSVAMGIFSALSYSLTLFFSRNKILIVGVCSLAYALHNLIFDVLGKPGRVLSVYYLTRTNVKNLDFTYFVSVMGYLFVFSVVLLLVKIFIIKDEL